MENEKINIQERLDEMDSQLVGSGEANSLFRLLCDEYSDLCKRNEMYAPEIEEYKWRVKDIIGGYNQLSGEMVNSEGYDENRIVIEEGMEIMQSEFNNAQRELDFIDSWEKTDEGVVMPGDPRIRIHINYGEIPYKQPPHLQIGLTLFKKNLGAMISGDMSLPGLIGAAGNEELDGLVFFDPGYFSSNNWWLEDFRNRLSLDKKDLPIYNAGFSESLHQQTLNEFIDRIVSRREGKD